MILIWLNQVTIFYKAGAGPAPPVNQEDLLPTQPGVTSTTGEGINNQNPLNAINPFDELIRPSTSSDVIFIHNFSQRLWTI